MKSLGKTIDVSRHTLAFRLFALTTLALAALIWQSQRADAWFDSVSPELQQALQQEIGKGADAPLLAAVYVGTSPAPYWLNDDGLNERGQAAIEVLHNASAHGISPDHYGVKAIEQNLLADSSPKALAQADAAISMALLRYAQDLQTGVADANWYDRLGTLPIAPEPAALWSDIIKPESLEEAFDTMAPRSETYVALQKALGDYSELAKRGGWPTIAAGPSLKPGMNDTRVASLRQLLILTGDYDTADNSSSSYPTSTSRPGAPQHASAAPQPSSTALYDEALVEAVKKFQTRHGLEPDGAVGPGTLAALNTPVQTRIDQLRVTMDQVRQLPDHLGSKYILVNIPGFHLTGYDEGKPVIEMNVVVGQPRRKTPLFSNAITQAVFNPDWSVPTRIAREDFPGKLRANPNYLAQNGFSVYSDGVRVDASSVSADNVGYYTLRQASGGGNALGKIKFPIPDNQSVYLHDTSHRELFAKADRALSSGCIRVQNPEALAQYVLKGNAEWDEQSVAAAYASRTHRTVEINPVPVHAVYWTAWVDEKGTPHFYKDIYQRDGRILSALNEVTKPAATQMAAR